MSSIYVAGIGAVSPGGWGVPVLRETLTKNERLPLKEVQHPNAKTPLFFRAVPPPVTKPSFLSHARLRRASPITHFSVAAGLEALGEDAAKITRGELELGIIFCAMSGCINYSRRFYDETLRDPGTASPLVFPETVFNAPASHIAALLGTKAINYTIIGDPGIYLQGLAMAADWLSDGRVDRCLVIGAEEGDWLTAGAFHLFRKSIVLSEGAGAVYLSNEGTDSQVQLKAITNAHLFLKNQSRRCAVQKMRNELPNAADILLCDSTQGLPILDAPELEAWKNWRGKRIAPKHVLGEGLMAAAAWQCVVGLDSLLQKSATATNISVAGCNQQAIGAHFSISHSRS